MMPSSVQTPIRPAPRHSGQSAANSEVPTSTALSTAVTDSSRNVRIVVFPSVIRFAPDTLTQTVEPAGTAGTAPDRLHS